MGIRSALLLLLLASTASRAAEVPEGGWLVGVGAGLGMPYGPAQDKLGSPMLLGGQAIFHRRKEWSVGAQLDRLAFKSKGGSRANMTAALAVLRGNIGMDFEKSVPYMLFGVGYSESHADVAAGGEDRGAGPAFCLGLGLDYALAGPLGTGWEVKFQRMSAPLGRLGLTGATVIAFYLRLNFGWGPGGDPFESAPRSLHQN